MLISSTNFVFVFIVSFYMMTAMFYCNCGKDQCLKNPRTETTGIYFRLKDSVTGNDIISVTSGSQLVADTIKLTDLHTGFSYRLEAARSVNETILFSTAYNKGANVTDSLVFKFGSSVPDTLIVYTGMINGWRGDECPSVKETGIIKVTIRNQVLIETTNDEATFTLKK